MSVAISAITFWADWPFPRDSAFDVRATSNRSWVSAEGELVPAGQSRVVGTGTITSLRPAIPSISLPSTTAGVDDQTAKFTVTLHRTGLLKVVYTVLDDFTLPVSFDPATTWAAVRINKNGKQPLRDTSTYTKTETDYQISLAAGTLNDASDVVKGRTRLSVAPLSASSPIAVGDNNDPRVGLRVHCTGTADSAAIQAALDAAAAAGGGIVTMYGASGAGLGATGVTIGSYVKLTAAYADFPAAYSGTGIAFDGHGSQSPWIDSIYVTTSNDAATGVRLGGATRFARLTRFTVNGTNVGSNTGIGIDLDANSVVDQFSGYLYLEQVLCQGNKFGIRLVGSTGQRSWTLIRGNVVSLIGLGSGVAGGIGIWADNKTNLEGSSIDSLSIENFERTIQYDNAASAFGFGRLFGGLENNGNSNLPSLPASFNGEIYAPHTTGYYQRSSSNGLSNLWEREKRLNGDWTEETYGDKLDVQYDGNTTFLRWGLQRGGSIIGGEYAADKFTVGTGGSGAVGIDQNWFKLLQYKQAWAPATPDRGSFERGSIVWNTAQALGSPIGWVCTVSGTVNKTITAATTAATTSGLATIVLNQATNIAVNDYITIAGVTGTKRIKFITDSTHMTLDSVCDATVAAGAVAYTPFTFVALASLNDPGAARVVSQFNKTSSAALSDVTGLSLMVTSGVVYAFTAELYTTSNVAGGVKVGIGGTCTATTITYDGITSDGATVFTSRATAKGSAVGGVTAVTAAHVTITGTIAVANGGTLTVQFAQNNSDVNTSSVLINSTFQTTPIG